MEATPYVFANWFTNPDSLTEMRGYGYDTLLEAALGQDSVLLYEQDDDYQGDWVAVVTDGERIGLVNGYFGSCGGCDALEGVMDDGTGLQGYRDLLTEYLQSVRTFPSWEALRTYLEGLDEQAWEFRRNRSRLLELAKVAMPLTARDILGCLKRDAPDLDPVEAARRSMLLQ